MGSHSWVRDKKSKSGGRNQVVGAPAVVPVTKNADDKKRKLVWKRDADDDPRVKRSDEEQEKENKRRKLLELKAQIAQKEALLQETRLQQEEHDHQEEIKFNEEERLKEDRRKKFEASFADAFESTREALARDMTSKRAVAFADEKEINRILNSKSDYDMLKLAPGSSAAELRKRYREMALSCHPDKCSHPKSQEAFRKIVTAYTSLSKYL